MEIKTCEEYVLSKLFEKENRVDELEKQVEGLQFQLSAVTSDYKCIRDDLLYLIDQFHTDTYGEERYVESDRVWEKFDGERFTKLYEIITKYSED